MGIAIARKPRIRFSGRCTVSPPETTENKEKVNLLPLGRGRFFFPLFVQTNMTIHISSVERVIHGVLEASLIAAGIDPRTPKAQHGKKLDLDRRNPFASKEQIDEDTRRTVDNLIKK